MFTCGNSYEVNATPVSNETDKHLHPVSLKVLYVKKKITLKRSKVNEK